MSNEDDLAYLLAQRAWIQARIERLEPRDRLMRINLESHLRDLDEQISAMEAQADTLSRQAKVTLAFGGKPVLDSRAIQASFGAEAIQKFQQLVSTTAASRGGRELAMRGRIPDEERHRLFITGVVPGSFGFELEEVTAEPGDAGALRAAVEEANHLLQATLASDEVFVEAVSQYNPRVAKALVEFLKLVAGSSATLRVSTEDTECSFDTPEAIAAAAERAQKAKMTEAALPMSGILSGVFAATRRFELKLDETGEIIHGRISADIADPLALTPHMGKRCTAQMWIVTLERAGKEQRTYYLTDIEPAPEAEPGPG